jgi:hypothetical protein
VEIAVYDAVSGPARGHELLFSQTAVDIWDHTAAVRVVPGRSRLGAVSHIRCDIEVPGAAV